MSEYTDTALRLLDSALGAMNHAVALTAEHGPGDAMEFIADYLNDTDGIDNELADNTPEDWLTRWQVTRVYDFTKETDK